MNFSNNKHSIQFNQCIQTMITKKLNVIVKTSLHDFNDLTSSFWLFNNFWYCFKILHKANEVTWTISSRNKSIRNWWEIIFFVWVNLSSQSIKTFLRKNSINSKTRNKFLVEKTNCVLICLWTLSSRELTVIFRCKWRLM